MLSKESLFSGLDSLNETLENLELYIYEKLEYINTLDLKSMAREKIQAEIDKICISINNKVNPILQKKREQVIQSLKIKYQNCMEFIAFVKPFIELLQLDFSLDNVISWLKEVASFWLNVFLGPYKSAVDFVKELTPRLERLADNIERLSTLQPPDIPDLPSGTGDINLNKLKIDIEPFTVDDIIA